MLQPSLNWLSRNGNAGLVRQGLRGVEKETLRVTPDGELAQSPHPAELGSALTHPFLTTDYSEALLEFVTPPYRSNAAMLSFLSHLHGAVHRALENELLWPASMPCIVDADRMPIAHYGPSNEGMLRTVYRRGLGHRYGRAMQAIAGAHFNYSPPADFWPAYRDWRESSEPLQQFRSAEFMGLVRNYRRCAWLVIYLFGESPAFCKSFRPEGHALLSELDAGTWFAPHATSLRMSDMGYRNKYQARLQVSANSLGEYVGGLRSALTSVDPHYERIGVRVDGKYRQLNANVLQLENEYYSSVRPKPAAGSGRAAAALERYGVEYVEIRSLDLNIGEPLGMSESQMRFLEALLLYCLLADSPPIEPSEQREIDATELAIAREGRTPGLRTTRLGRETPVVDWALELVEGIAQVAELLDDGDRTYSAAVQSCRDAVRDPELTPSARLLADLRATGVSFFQYALQCAQRQREHFLALPLDSDTAQHLADSASRSATEARALENESSESFDEFRRRYFDKV